MRTEETMAAEKIRRKPFVTLLGNCQDCGQPVIAGQGFLRSDHGIRHALCFYIPRTLSVRVELKPNMGH